MQGLLPAIVFSTEDPLSLGRIQVECPLIAPGEILPHEEDNWIPVLESFVVTGKAGGSHSLLQKGNQVMLAPRFGSSQQAPSWVVVGAVHSTVDKLHPLLDRTKGTYGSVSPAGKIEINNDKEGSQIVSYPNGATQQVSKEGNITSQTKGGARSHLGQDGELRIENEKSFTTHDPSGQVASGNAGGASSVLSSSGNVDVTASSGTALSLQSSGTLSGSGGSTGQALSKLEKASTKLQEAIKSSEVASKKLSGALSNLPSSSPNSSKEFPKIFQTIGESLEKIGNGSAESLGVPNLQEIANFLRYKLDILKPQINVLLDTDRTLSEFPAQLSGLFATQELILEPATLDAIALTLTNLRYNRKLQINFLLSKLLGNDYAPETGILEQLELEPVMVQIAAIDPINPDAIATLQGLLPKKLQGIEHEILMRAIALPPAERIAALIGATRIQDAKDIHSQVSKAFPNFSKQTSKDFSNSSKDASNDSNSDSNSLETPPEEVVTQSAKDAQQKIQSFLGGIPKGSSAAKVVAGSSSSQLLAAGGASKVAAEPGTAYLKSPAGKVEAGGGGASMSGGGGSVGASASGVAMVGKQGEKVEISNNKLSMGGGGAGQVDIDKDQLILHGEGGATISLVGGKIEGTADAIAFITNAGAQLTMSNTGAVLLQDSQEGKIEIDKSIVNISGKEIAIQGGDSIALKSEDKFSVDAAAMSLTGELAIATPKFAFTSDDTLTLQIDPSGLSLINLTGTTKIQSQLMEINGGDPAHKLEVKTEGIFADGINIVQSIGAAQAQLTTAESKIQALETKVDWGELDAQSIGQFYREAQGDTSDPALNTVSVFNLFATASPYPARLGAIAVSPNGSSAIANGQRLTFSNRIVSERRAAVTQLAVLNNGATRIIINLANGSPIDTNFHPVVSFHEIYIANGQDVTATGSFVISNNDSTLTWTAAANSPVAVNTRVWVKLAINYPEASGLDDGVGTFDTGWISNVAIDKANFRPLSRDLTKYESPALGQNFIVVYERTTAAIETVYRKVSVTSSATGVLTLPIGSSGCFAFIEEEESARIDSPIITGKLPNTVYNALIYYAIAASDLWQIQATKRSYQGTQDKAFLNGAIFATQPRLYIHSQGGGKSIPATFASLGNNAIATWLPTVDDPLYSRYLFNEPIKEIGESASTINLTFRSLPVDPAGLPAYPILGRSIKVLDRDTEHERAIAGALANTTDRVYAITMPWISTPFYQCVLTFVALKGNVAMLVIATLNCAAPPDNPQNLVFDSDLEMAIDTFPLQPVPRI